VIGEWAIRASKHVLKSRSRPVPFEARAALERAYEILAVQEPNANVMRAAIGIPNVIIHDYLNLDRARREVVFAERRYSQVADFILTA
jgi:hypothetical protein